MISTAVLTAVVAVAVMGVCFVLLPMLLSSGDAIIITIAVIIVLVPVIYGAMKIFNSLKEQK